MAWFNSSTISRDWIQSSQLPGHRRDGKWILAPKDNLPAIGQLPANLRQMIGLYPKIRAYRSHIWASSFRRPCPSFAAIQQSRQLVGKPFCGPFLNFPLPAIGKGLERLLAVVMHVVWNAADTYFQKRSHPFFRVFQRAKY